MSPFPFLLRLLPAIVWDIADFLIGWIPVIGHVMDFAAPFVAYLLYRSGIGALINAWEIVDISNAIDMWVPTMTITALLFRRD